jgi:phospholipid/cholesterol/gamma-HCH transport system permease protein
VRVGDATYTARDSAVAALDFLGEITLGLGRLVTGRARVRGGDVVFELQRCGIQALPIVSLIAFLVGTILAFVGAVQLQQFGAEIYVANLVAIAMAREMGGIMTSIIMAGRTGSGFAAELGTMRVTQETDALATMGLRPIDTLVLPRVIALMVMMPLLTIYADVVGMLGGLAVGVGLMDISAVTYWNQTQYALTLTSCAVGVGKSVVFGLLVAMAGCLAGMQAGRSSAAVGEATTRAVVVGIVAIIVADGLFAVAFNVLNI